MSLFLFHLRLQKCRDFFQSELAQFKVADGTRFQRWHDGPGKVDTINRIGEGEIVQSSLKIYCNFFASHYEANPTAGRARRTK